MNDTNDASATRPASEAPDTANTPDWLDRPTIPNERLCTHCGKVSVARSLRFDARLCYDCAMEIEMGERICAQCGEYARPQTMQIARFGKLLCANCTADAAERLDGATTPSRNPRHQRAPCAVCRRIAPVEDHHIASRRQHPTLTIRVCLNCHSLLSLRQYQWLDAGNDWRKESHPVRCILQGVYDVVSLWLERSPAADAARDLLAMLWGAFCALVGYLRPTALADVTNLARWETRP